MTGSLYIGGVLFDSTLSSYGLFLNILAGIIFLSIMSYMIYKNDGKLGASFFLTFMGMSSFELLTGALRKVQFMGSWAYGFWDISWVLAIVWTGVLYRSDTLISPNTLHKDLKTIALTSVVVLFLTLGASITGVIGYEPEALASVNLMIQGFPLDALYYIPMRIFIVYGFKKYFDQWIFDHYTGSTSTISFKNFFIVLVCVLCIELLIEPTINTTNLPAWSYIYKDISLILSLGWTIIIAVTAYTVNKVFYSFDIFVKFSYAIFLSTIVGGGFLSLLIKYNIVSLSTGALQTHTINSLSLGNTGLTTMTLVSTMLFFVLLIPASKYRTSR